MTTLSVSVALATYNSAPYIEAQVRSILAQTLVPDEVVVADDGSTDETIEIVRSVVSGHGSSSTRLVVLPMDGHRGVSGNFARGISACTGDLVALSDHDDVWHQDRLAVAVRSFLDDPTLLFAHADARLVDEDGVPLGSSLLDALGVTSADRAEVSHGHAFETYIRRNLATGATSMFRRSLVSSALPIPPEWVHDEWLAIVASAVGKVRLIEQELIDYRQHASNQIGVRRPTVRYRIGRMLEPRAERYNVLSRRSELLLSRLEQVGAPDDFLALARKKARFEKTRSTYPAGRLGRVGPVLREYLSGSYRALSSQRNRDVIRDLLQPA